MSEATDFPEIVITESMEDGAVAFLRQRFPVVYDPTLVDAPARLYPLLRQARAVCIRNRTNIDETLLAHAPVLMAIGRLGVGLDNIDQPACGRRGVAVYPAIGANARSVAEYVVATVLITLRNVYDRSTAVGEGLWPRATMTHGREAHGKTVGIIGFGNIGQHTARLLEPLGLRLIAYDPINHRQTAVLRELSVEPVTQEELLARSDVVTLHLPLDASTRNSFGSAQIAHMRRGTILINTARGGIVDEAAVADAIRSEKLGGAAFDVFAQEPLIERSPLAGLKNVWLTPHIAGLSQESDLRVSQLIAERVTAHLSAAPSLAY